LSPNTSIGKVFDELQWWSISSIDNYVSLRNSECNESLPC